MQQLSGLHLKDFVTVCSLASGVFSMALSAQGAYSYALVAILAAMVFDFLDGKVARGTDAANPFGRELDSLSDAVAFGAAPAFASMAALGFSWISIAFAVAYSACAVVRLARFNLQGEAVFIGLPTPAAAMLVMLVVGIAPNPWALPALAATSAAMVSDIRLPKA